MATTHGNRSESFGNNIEKQKKGRKTNQQKENSIALLFFLDTRIIYANIDKPNSAASIPVNTR